MEEEIFFLLAKSIATEYAHEIAGEIVDAVKIDVEATADAEYNEDDLRLAVGRVLCERLNIEI